MDETRQYAVAQSIKAGSETRTVHDCVVGVSESDEALEAEGEKMCWG